MEVLSKQGIRLRGLVERGLGCPGFGRPVTRLSPTDLAADHWGMGELHWDQRKHSSEPIPKGRRIELRASWMVVSSGEVRYTPHANRYILPLEQHRSELHGSTLHRFLSVKDCPYIPMDFSPEYTFLTVNLLALASIASFSSVPFLIPFLPTFFFSLQYHFPLAFYYKQKLKNQIIPSTLYLKNYLQLIKFIA